MWVGFNEERRAYVLCGGGGGEMMGETFSQSVTAWQATGECHKMTEMNGVIILHFSCTYNSLYFSSSWYHHGKSNGMRREESKKWIKLNSYSIKHNILMFH